VLAKENADVSALLLKNKKKMVSYIGNHVLYRKPCLRENQDTQIFDCGRCYERDDIYDWMNILFVDVIKHVASGYDLSLSVSHDQHNR
jgi:hypothetical protein